jgi:hypothetical protein
LAIRLSVAEVLAACDTSGRLPTNRQSEAAMLVGMIEQRLA